VLAGEAMPELAEALSVRPVSTGEEDRKTLSDILQELMEIRALLAGSAFSDNHPSKEKRS